MLLTPEQEKIGRDNFDQVVGQSRRDFMKTAVAAGAGMGAVYFGYEKLQGDKVKCAVIGTGDEGNVLITQHPDDYMDIVAIADLRPTNRDRAFKGDGNEHRVGLVKKLGAERAEKIQVFSNHRELLAKKDELGLEMVIIAVPLNQHAPIAMECLDAGLHVLSEKLMAHNIKECKQLIRKAKEKKLLYAVGHQRHYSVLYDNANHLVKEGHLGEIKFIRAQWHRNNSFPGRDSWRKSIPRDDAQAVSNEMAKEFGYEDLNQLVNWRLFNETGGGLMAELGSHQMDAASIFLGKVHPLSVQGFGGKIFYGIPGVGPEDKWDDDREIDDSIFVTFEFPGKTYWADEEQTEVKNPRDVCIVTYSSISTNRWEPYGEAVFGSRATLVMKTEKEALLYKEASPTSGGGIDTRLWLVEGKSGGGVIDSYETTAAPKAVDTKVSEVSRGYTEEMEHFCHCIRTNNFKGPKEGGLKCNGTVAMADAIMAITANLAMKHKIRIPFKKEWFDPESDATPEADYANYGEQPVA
ncbi:MAG: dehydrogenase [Planctomyces sp.]|nr:dehydrogenase [Planctomyces sp.]